MVGAVDRDKSMPPSLSPSRLIASLHPSAGAEPGDGETMLLPAGRDAEAGRARGGGFRELGAGHGVGNVICRKHPKSDRDLTISTKPLLHFHLPP
jgi:hypothetical protein